MELQATKFRTTRQGVRDLDQVEGRILPISGGPVPGKLRAPNIGERERAASTITGGTLMGAGLANFSAGGVILMVAGAALAYRGLSGNCELFRILGINTADATKAPNEMAYRG